jgi:hypothetical protein
MKGFFNGLCVGISITYLCTGHPLLAATTASIGYTFNKLIEKKDEPQTII